VVDLLEDTIRATRWYLDPANHDEAVKIAAAFDKTTPVFVDWAFTHRDQYRSPDVMPNPEALQRNVDTLWKLGLLKERLDMAPHVDLSLVREAASRLP
jgi:NitT/TauT family transport system substrate-binding protein